MGKTGVLIGLGIIAFLAAINYTTKIFTFPLPKENVTYDHVYPPVAMSDIPVNYYDNVDLIPEGRTLDEYLTAFEWEHPYEVGKFDCSQMTAYMEWLLQNAGYDTLIALGDSILGYHAWVLVRLEKGTRIETLPGLHMQAKKTGYYPYECTKGFFYGPGRFVPKPSHIWKNLYEVENYYGKDNSNKGFFRREFAWWDVIPIRR